MPIFGIFLQKKFLGFGPLIIYFVLVKIRIHTLFMGMKHFMILYVYAHNRVFYYWAVFCLVTPTQTITDRR
jgi:hypothetical protein